MSLGFSDLTKRLFRQFARKPAPAPTPARRARLDVTALEDRVVPAISGNVWYDTNANGTRDAGENGAGFVSVSLYQNGLWVTGTGTDANGDYSFSEPSAGDDEVVALPMYSWFPYTVSTPLDGNGRSAAAGGAANVGLVGTGPEAGGQGTISGSLFFDANADGVKGTSETTGLSGALVELYYGSVFVGNATTTSSGAFSFGDLWAGSGYTLYTNMLPAGWWVTTPQTAGATAATAPTTGSSTVNIGVAPPVVTVSRVSDAAEGGANGKFRFTRTGDTSQDLTVNYTVGGTADLTDFTGPIGSVTIPAGFASADVDVWADDDTDSEPTETVEITLTASSGYALGSSSTAAVNIFDNDAQYVSVSKIADATEGGTAGTFRFTRIGDLSSALVVNYSVGGTAAAGTDFAALGGSAAFAARASTVDVMVSAIDNIRYASSRSVSLTVTSGTGYSVGSSPSTSMSIIEDEGAPVYWIGTDPAGWSIGSNWTSGMVPDASTAVYFDPAYSNYGVTTPALSSDVQLGELHVVNGYGGTITLASDLAVGKLELASAGATIDQPSATYGSDITANGMMVWTGGTINSTTHLANLNITGSTTALFAPTSGGTVSLGSSINLSSGAVATMKEGTINVTNDGTEINVNENCGMMVDPGANKETVVATSPGVTLGDKVRILEGAWVEVRSGTYSNDGWFVNSGGKFTLKADTGAFFSGKGRFGLNEAYDQEDGSTFLYGGSELAVGSQQNVRFQGGTLQTVDAGTTSETWAKIQVGAMGGKLLFAGGDLYINSGPGVTSFGNNYGTLRVVGDVQWGPFGTFHVRVPAESNGTDADLWYATGTFTITSPVALGPQLAPVALSYENDPMTPTTGYTWLILRGDGGITAIQGLTMYDGDLWAHDAVGNPVTQWKLRAK